MATPQFRTKFDPAHGRAVEIAPGVERLTAPNSSAFTFHGTNTYIVGREEVAVIDPGPAHEAHFDALMAALDGRQVSHVFITHTHADHSPLAGELVRATGAATLAQGPHRLARDLHIGEENPLDDAADLAFAPDRRLAHGETVEGDGWALTAIHTPGHTANHMTLALGGTDLMFSGDHVMGWSTSIVAPPDGSMSDYMASLDEMLGWSQATYLPGHGGRIEKAKDFVRALKVHRKMRETAILSRVRAGDETIARMVAIIYREIDPKLHGAAGLSVLAHLEDLLEKGLVTTDGPASIDGEYRPG